MRNILEQELVDKKIVRAEDLKSYDGILTRYMHDLFADPLGLLGDNNKMGIMSDKVTLRNKDELCEEDYMKLVKICASAVKNYAGTDDYRMYTKPIGEYIKQFAPLALGTVMKVMQSAPKAETRLKAAQDLLNRSGEKEPDRVADVQVPVQVNIMLTDQKGNTVKYEGGS